MKLQQLSFHDNKKTLCTILTIIIDNIKTKNIPKLCFKYSIDKHRFVKIFHIINLIFVKKSHIRLKFPPKN